MPEFEARLDRLDTSLFSIRSQSTQADWAGWLAIQRAIRKAGAYTYLEIGSYLGGSIQQHLLDPLCRSIISIDKRAIVAPDERDELPRYEDASTEKMLENLRKIDARAVNKITTFDCDARDVDPGKIAEPPKFCFIDGEHTKSAVTSDFAFCLRVCDPDAAICFHDARIVYPGLIEIISVLKAHNITFVGRRLTGDTLAILLRDCPAATDAYILKHSSEPTKFFRTMRVRHAFKRALPKWSHSTFRAMFPAP